MTRSYPSLARTSRATVLANGGRDYAALNEYLKRSYAAASDLLRRAGIKTRPNARRYADQRGQWNSSLAALDRLWVTGWTRSIA
jgi:hypothetical protein